MLSWLISAVGLDALKAELANRARRTQRRIVLKAIAGVLWIFVFGYALAALTVWIAQMLGPLAACGIVAGLFAAIAVALQIAASATRRKEPSPSVAQLLAEDADRKDGSGTPDGDTLGSLAVVALAGYVIGRHLFRR